MIHASRTRRLTLMLGSILLISHLQATAEPAHVILSLIESSPRPTPERDPNRMVPFVELRHVDGRDREYSVPFASDMQAKNVAATLMTTWKQYQDTLHWALQVGVNSAITAVPLLGQEHTTRFLNCDLQLPADLSIGAGQLLTGTSWIKKPLVSKFDLPLSNPTDDQAKDAVKGVTEGWNDGDIDLHGTYVPLVDRRNPRTNYCKYSATTFVPDELSGIYTPNVQVCAFGACLSGPNFPKPLNVNTTALANRLRKICLPATKAESAVYQKENLKAVATNLPLAIQWNGVLTPSTDGLRSGTTMSPIFGVPTSTSQVQALTNRLADLSQQDPRLLPYLTGTLPTVADLSVTNGNPGIPALETLKRYLPPTLLNTEEKQGYALMFQVWQQLDTVVDARPIIYWAKALRVDVLGAVIPIPIPIPVPSGLVTSNLIANTCVFTPALQTGTTVINATRFHYGLISVPEGYDIPNLNGTPILRVGQE